MKDKTKFNARIQKLLDQSLVSTEFLKASSLLDWNIQPEKILPYIIEAQELKLEPLIGTKLYRKLQESSLSFEYELLLDKFVSKYLLHQALSSYLKIAAYSVKQGGVYRHQSTDAEPVEHFEISILVKNESYKADAYSKRMLDFLKKYETVFVEYRECVGDGIGASRSKRNIIGGWNLQNTRQPKTQLSEDLWASDGGCCGGETSICAGGGCPPDFDIFVVNLWSGIEAEADPSLLDLSLLTEENDIPNSITAQPGGLFFWIVSTIRLDITQLDTIIPLSTFSDTDPLTEVYVYQELAGKFYIRIKMQDVYATPVQLGLKLH